MSDKSVPVDSKQTLTPLDSSARLRQPRLDLAYDLNRSPYSRPINRRIEKNFIWRLCYILPKLTDLPLSLYCQSDVCLKASTGYGCLVKTEATLVRSKCLSGLINIGHTF